VNQDNTGLTYRGLHARCTLVFVCVAVISWT